MPKCGRLSPAPWEATIPWQKKGLMWREGVRGFSYLPAEGREGVQALFVLGGVALLGVIPAAALREQRQGESQPSPVLQGCLYLSPRCMGAQTPSTGPEPPSPPELLIWKSGAPGMEQHSPELTHGADRIRHLQKGEAQEGLCNKVLSSMGTPPMRPYFFYPFQENSHLCHRRELTWKCLG